MYQKEIAGSEDKVAHFVKFLYLTSSNRIRPISKTSHRHFIHSWYFSNWLQINIHYPANVSWAEQDNTSYLLIVLVWLLTSNYHWSLVEQTVGCSPVAMFGLGRSETDCGLLPVPPPPSVSPAAPPHSLTVSHIITPYLAFQQPPVLFIQFILARNNSS